MSKFFGSAEYIQDVNESSLSILLAKIQQQQPSGIFILCCDKDTEQLQFFESFLPTISTQVFGGVFPAIIHKEQTYEQGMILVPMFMPLDVKLYPNLQSAIGSELTFDFQLDEYQSLMVLVDGFSRDIDFGLNQLFQQFGQSLQVFGGGAGSLDFIQKNCLFTNQGMFSDAMLVVAMQQKIELAIGHGWEVLAGPFLANQVDDNRILQLNFQPALQVYKDVVEQHDGRLFIDHDFFDLSKTYPFGLERLDDDLLVRDPVTCEGDSLVCVGKVPENTMLYILNGQPENLVHAAVKAVKSKTAELPNTQGVLFDCISRKLFLEDDFGSELQQISSTLSSEPNLFGALVLGEISSGQSGAIHFHNKTAVVALALE
jgi:hypothetical protein